MELVENLDDNWYQSLSVEINFFFFYFTVKLCHEASSMYINVMAVCALQTLS